NNSRQFVCNYQVPYTGQKRAHRPNQNSTSESFTYLPAVQAAQMCTHVRPTGRSENFTDLPSRLSFYLAVGGRLSPTCTYRRNFRRITNPIPANTPAAPNVIEPGSGIPATPINRTVPLNVPV